MACIDDLIIAKREVCNVIEKDFSDECLDRDLARTFLSVYYTNILIYLCYLVFMLSLAQGRYKLGYKPPITKTR